MASSSIIGTIMMISCIVVACVMLYMSISESANMFNKASILIQPAYIRSSLEYNKTSDKARLYLEVQNLGNHNITITSVVIENCTGHVLQVVSCPREYTITITRRRVTYTKEVRVNVSQIFQTLRHGVNASIQLNELKVKSITDDGYVSSMICINDLLTKGFTYIPRICILLTISKVNNHIYAIYSVLEENSQGQYIIVDYATRYVDSSVNTYNITVTFTRVGRYLFIFTENKVTLSGYLNGKTVLSYSLYTLFGTLSLTPALLVPFNAVNVSFSLNNIVYRINNVTKIIKPQTIVVEHHKYVRYRYTYTSVVPSKSYKLIVIEFTPKFKIVKGECYSLVVVTETGEYFSRVSTVRIVR